MQISPADLNTLLTLIDRYQTARRNLEAVTVRNQAAARAIARKDEGAQQLWDEARAQNSGVSRALLEARSALADFASKVELIPGSPAVEEPKP